MIQDTPSAGLEEGRRALGEWADSVKADVAQVMQRQEKVAVLFEPGMVQRPSVGVRTFFRGTQKRFQRMKFPLVIDSWSKEREAFYRDRGYHIFRILPESAEALIAPDRVYVRLEEPARQIPLRFVPVVVTDSLRVWERGRFRILTQPFLVDVTSLFALQLTVREIWQVLADRFA